MNQCALIDPAEAAVLLQAMADRAGPMSDVLGAVMAQVQGPQDEPGEDAAVTRNPRAWKPDLRYRSLVERLPVVTFMASLDERVQELYISPQIETLLGFTQEEWLNDPFLWFRQLHVDDREKWIAEFAETCANGKTFRAEYRVLARDGHVVWVQGECQLIRDHEGRPVFLQGVAFDITHLKRAVQIEEARHAAEADSRAKSEFLARMSHEIRTPLNGVVGMIDLLLATEMTDLQRRYAGLARDAADSLMLVINDILDFSKIEAGKVEIEAIEFDVYAVVEDLTELLAPMASRKGLSLSCSLRPQIPRKAVGDPNRLRQVLTNLVNNALKFTAEGSVDIHADLQSAEGTALLIRFHVQDTGIGIPADRIDRLFQSFSQVDSSTTRKFGGTGLGLAISKRLVELMGGEMGINSEAGKGSTFWFTIKVGAVIEPAAEDIAGAIRAVRLLAVEADDRARQFLARQIDGRFSSESRAVTPNEALETLQVAAGRGEPFTVTLIPYGTAEGENLKSDMQRNEGLRDIQLIALTDADDPTEPEVFSREGFAGVVRRPLTQSRLLDVIATRAVQCFIDTHTPALIHAEKSVEGLHFLVAEDNEMNQFVTRETLRLRGCTCDIVGDGAQAVDAVRNGKFDAVLMDCQMPGMDGLEASRRIRQHEALTGGSHIPIIALTAEAIDGDREKCLASGMDGYVTKPIDAQDLFATIRLLVKVPADRQATGVTTPSASTAAPAPLAEASLIHPHASAADASPEVAPTAASSAADEPIPPAAAWEGPVPIDVDALLTRCMQNVDFASKTLEQFGRRASADIELMRATVAAGDTDQLRRLAHNLKAVAAHVAAGELQAVALEIEQAGARQDLNFITDQLARLDEQTRRCLQYIPQAVRQIAQSGGTQPVIPPNKVA